MARIIGTRFADELIGTDANDLIRGRRGEDSIFGGLGDDVLYGDDGNDSIQDLDGRSETYGGRGSDFISLRSGVAYGGPGNDRIIASDASWATGGAPGAAIVGGVGSDTMSGAGVLYGDQSPGMASAPGGNDQITLISDTDGAWANGGLGSDTFTVLPGFHSFAVVSDFRAGEDKLFSYDSSSDEPFNLWGNLDANGDNVLDWQDSIGPDGDWTTPDGRAVYTDGTNLILGLDATWANATATDATSWLVLNNVTSVAAADWLFPDWAA